MTLQSRILEAAKTFDAWAGIPLARRLAGRRRSLPTQVDDALLVRLWGLGNLTLLAPVLQANRDRRLRLLTLTANVSFVRHHFPHVEVLPLPAPQRAGFAPAVLAACRALRRQPPDVVVDLEQFLRLPLVLLRQACQAPIVGVDTPGQERRPLLDVSLPEDPTRHAADTFADLCREAGLRTPRGPGGLRVTDAAVRRMAALLPRGPGPLVLVHPGTGDHALARRWPAERFGRLAAHLQQTLDARIVVTGVHRERPLSRALLDHARPGAQDLTGELDVATWAACLAAADLLVTGDTGPLHMADALGTRSVALYGPASPLRYGPRLPGSRALYADLPCSPCLDERSMKRTDCRHFACMQALDVASVARACGEVLGTPAREPARATRC